MALSYYHVTVSGAGSKTGADWANAYGLAEYYSHTIAAGDVFYFKSGTYTLTADLGTTTDGTLTDPIAVIGVKSGTTATGNAVDYDDFATGDDRPYFNGGASYDVNFDNYAILRNIRAESEQDNVIRADQHSIIENCYALNDYSADSASKVAIYGGGSGNRIINCEVESYNTGIDMASGLIAFCYVKQLGTRTTATAVILDLRTLVFGCIVDGYAKGVFTTGRSIHILQCVFAEILNNPAISGSGTTTGGWSVINTIIYSCGQGLYWGSNNNNIYQNNNTFYDNTFDFNNVPKEGDTEDLFCDFNLSSADPKFRAASSEDFRIFNGSPSMDTGKTLELGIG